MRPLARRWLGLCLPPVLLAAADATMTLAGQSAAYWAGNYADVNEASPTFHHLLSSHPLAFVAGIAAWMLLFVSLILLLPQTLALAVSIVVTLAHAWGTSSWLMWHVAHGYQLSCALFLATGLGLAVGIRWGWGATPPGDAPALARLPAAARWLLIAALFAIGVYLFLWPRSA